MDYKYTITLADGQKLTNLGINGNNYVSQTQIDESIFEDNLSTMTVSDGKNEDVYHDVEFIQQMQWMDGTYYLAFRELTEQEKMIKNMIATIEEVNEMKSAIERGLTI